MDSNQTKSQMESSIGGNSREKLDNMKKTLNKRNPTNANEKKLKKA